MKAVIILNNENKELIFLFIKTPVSSKLSFIFYWILSVYFGDKSGEANHRVELEEVKYTSNLIGNHC